MSVLQRRQDQFKAAALEAKKKGEVEQAKEYLRNYKGFDQLIAATNSGLPVDMNTVRKDLLSFCGVDALRRGEDGAVKSAFSFSPNSRKHKTLRKVRLDERIVRVGATSTRLYCL